MVRGRERNENPIGPKIIEVGSSNGVESFMRTISAQMASSIGKRRPMGASASAESARTQPDNLCRNWASKDCLPRNFYSKFVFTKGEQCKANEPAQVRKSYRLQTNRPEKTVCLLMFSSLILISSVDTKNHSSNTSLSVRNATEQKQNNSFLGLKNCTSFDDKAQKRVISFTEKVNLERRLNEDRSGFDFIESKSVCSGKVDDGKVKIVLSRQVISGQKSSNVTKQRPLSLLSSSRELLVAAGAASAAAVGQQQMLIDQTIGSGSSNRNISSIGSKQEVNNELIELLAQFYAHTKETQVQVEQYLILFESDSKNRSEAKSNRSNEKGVIDKEESKRASLEKFRNNTKMKFGADEESLIKWLRQRQEKFSSLKNATFELLTEFPNKTINVCPDGPKILVLPNVSDILYCYTRDQWIEKLWSDLKLSAFHYPIIVLNILIFLIGTTGNIFVCLSVYRNHQLRNVTNYFIVNLAFADFLVILICLPATVIWDLSLTWFFGTISCKLIMFLQDISISVSVLTLTAISIDRYYAICYPLRFKSNLNQAKRMIILIWIVSLITMAPDLIYLSAKDNQELSEAGLDTVLYSDCNYNWTERSSKIFQFVKTILLYLLPFMFMFSAHYKIMRTLNVASLTVNNKLQSIEKFNQVDTTNRTDNHHHHHRASSACADCKFKLISTGLDSVHSNKEVWLKSLVKLAPGKKCTDTTLVNVDNSRDNSTSSNREPDQCSKHIRFIEKQISKEEPIEELSIHSADHSNQTTLLEVKLRSNGISDNATTTTTACEERKKTTNAIDPTNEMLTSLTIFNSNQTNCSSDLTNQNKPNNDNTQIIMMDLNTLDRGHSSELKVTMHNKNKLESRRTAAKMLMAIVIMFGICYLPVHLINFLRQFIEDIPQTDITSTISMLSHCACYLNSAINPIIYNYMNSIFRAEFKKFLSCFSWCERKKQRVSRDTGRSIMSQMAVPVSIMVARCQPESG